MKFLLFCEGPGDDEDLRALTWTALRSARAWLQGFDDFTQAGHEWVRTAHGERFLKWAHVNDICDRLHVPPVRRLGQSIEHRMTRRALNMLLAHPEVSPAEGFRALLVHDSDGSSRWLEGLLAARDEWLAEHRAAHPDSDVDVAVGVAHPEHEAWLIATFEPRDGVERARLEDLHRELGFDPTREPERLTSGRSIHPKDAKRVLDRLAADDERRRGLLRDASVDALMARGATCGLADFVRELAERAP